MPSLHVQPLPVHTLTPPSLPAIRAQCASSDHIPLSEFLKTSPGNIKPVKTLPSSLSRSPVKHGRVRRREGLRQNTKKPSALPSHMVKEVEQSKGSKDKKQRQQQQNQQQEQQEQRDIKESAMSPRSDRASPVSSKASSPGASPPSSNAKRVTKPTAKDADWADVTDPEERRRIQNRIAQRKFREKARENKEKAEREMRNQENAGNSYRIPTVEDFMNDTETSGLPWGSINFGLFVSRGLETESRRSSGRGTFIGDDSYQSRVPPIPYTQGFPQAPSYGSSGPDDAYMEDASYGYSPVIPGFNPLTPQ